MAHVYVIGVDFAEVLHEGTDANADREIPRYRKVEIVVGPTIFTVGMVGSDDRATTTEDDELCDIALVSDNLRVYTADDESSVRGTVTGDVERELSFTEFKYESNNDVSTVRLVNTFTSQCIEDHTRPTLPLEPVTSSVRSLQLPKLDGADKLTTGTTGVPADCTRVV